MSLTSLNERRRFQQVWNDPSRTILTLESFSRTETDGAADIARVAEQTVDPWLREHYLRHAEDERRHGEMFARLAHAARERHPDVPSAGQVIPFDLTRGRSNSDEERTAHGFKTAGRYDDFSDVEFIAMVHEAEKKAASLFQLQHDLTAHLPDVKAAFAQILKDEIYHVSYTKTALDRFREQGRGREVSRAVKAARGERFLGAWKRLGARATGNFGRLLLFVAYFTICAPFGLMSRRSKVSAGFQPVRSSTSSDPLRSQYL